MTRNADQNQRMRDERRERILGDALRLFAAKGLSATRVADIASAAEMSQGLLYHYFGSKEDIFTELVRRAFERMNAAAHGLEAVQMPPREKILTAMTQLVRGIDEGEDFARTVLLIAQAGVSEDTPEAARRIIEAESGVPYEVVEKIMRQGQEDGSVRQHDAAELAMLFWVTVKGLALHKAVNREAFKAPDVRILTSMFFVDENEEQGG